MMISKVELVDLNVRAVNEDGCDVLIPNQGTPMIKGNFLFNNNKISLVSPNGETLVIAVPFLQEGKVYIHFAFGTPERRICHSIEVDGLETIVDNLATMLKWARLEQEMGKDQPQS